MKKIYSSIFAYSMLCLLSLIGMRANAQTWNFSDEGVSESDAANLNADTENWTYDSTNNRWCNASTFTDSPLTANGAELFFTKGLLFTTPVADGIRLDDKKLCLTLNKATTIVTIKNAVKGYKLTVRCKSSSSTADRGINVTNVTPESGYFNQTTLESQTNVGTVTEDGDITLQSTGGMYVYEISLVDPTVAPPVEQTYNSVPLNTLKNQMRLTLTNSEIKYYNTDEVKVDIDKTTNKVTVTPLNGTWTDVYAGTVKSLTFSKAEATGSEGDFSNPDGQVEITEAKGWQESAYIKWLPFSGADNYNVYVMGGQYSSWTKIDEQLVRDYGTYCRADVVGLRASSDYSLKVVPCASGTEMTSAANEATSLNVINYVREDFAHKGRTTGIGAYNLDGTLKEGAHVIYVTANTAKTVSVDLVGGTFTGLQNIITGYQKGNAEKPLAVRIIGKVEAGNMDSFGSSAEGLQVKGKNSYSDLNITIEGIGDDATISGFGILCRNASSVEFRNFAIMLCMDDCLSLDTDNSNIWIHNMDLFYGSTGGAADQAKGDGTIDIKGDSKYISVAYNRFWDSGKSSLCGMTSETGPNWITYHHNWFDHSDSRHPRIRTMSVHVWIKHYDGVAKYGVGAAKQSNAFVEANYFRGTKYPMLTSQQGSDIASDPKGTFSGEDGGVIKSFGNLFAEKPSSFKYVTYQQNDTQYDAYEAETRNEQVPSSVAALKGGKTYSNFDTDNSIMYSYNPDAAADVPAKVTGYYGAGRLNHGDFTWSFEGMDSDYNVDSALKSALGNYKSSLVKIFGDENASSGETGGGETGGGESGGGESGGGDVAEGTVLCDFNSGAPSSSVFQVTGNYRTEDTLIDGVTYTKSLKMESSTNVSFTTSAAMKMTVYFGKSSTNYTLKYDDVKQTGDSTTKSLTLDVEAGSHTLTKADQCTIALIKLEPVTE